MKKLSMLVAGAVVAVAALSMACGGGNNHAPEVSAPEENPGILISGGGLVKPNTFLTYEGVRYELIAFMQVEMTDESEFLAAGAASQADIDLTGGPVVYERQVDPDAVYTLAPATDDDVAMWLRWRRN